jgi:hypothetical protein
VLDRNVHEIRVAVIGLPVGIGELHRFGDEVDEIGSGRVETGDIEAA